MTDSNVRPAPDALQFDRAAQAGEQQTDAASVTCSRCNAAIKTYYYHLDGETVCAACKQSAMQTSATQKSGGAFLRAAIFGFGAAVAGAAIYYGVIALASLEIGLVAILIGYMVGAAVRKGARGGGGRRYQILAISLTYFSVGLAYSPMAFQGLMEGRRIATASRRGTDSTAATTATTAPEETKSADSTVAAARVSDNVVAPANALPDSAGAAHMTAGRAVLALVIVLGATFLMIFALPIIQIVGSMPSGILSALIIGVGMHQAWRMTQSHEVKVTGPYKVGGDAAPAGA